MKMLSAGCWGLGALLLVCGPLRAQDTASLDSARTLPASAQHPAPSTTDTLRRPTTPMGAMFRSFALPGWGQAVYGRKVTAGFMLGVEGLSLGMILKIKSDQRYIEETRSGRLGDKHQQQQDWFTVLIFNHLMSGLEAYVSAHLYDFPGDLQARVLPAGGTGIGVRIPLGRR